MCSLLRRNLLQKCLFKDGWMYTVLTGMHYSKPLFRGFPMRVLLNSTMPSLLCTALAKCVLR